MTSVWVLCFVIFLTVCITTRAQDDTTDENYDNFDYSQPGIASENCTCVPFYQCENGNIITDGTGIVDPRQKTQDEELPVDEKYTPPACGPYHVCCSEPSETQTVKPYEHRCGIRNANGINARIISSHESGESEFGEWPWQVAILRKEGGGNALKCGGTLIDNQHVITVAHCADDFLDNIDLMVVRLGEWDTQNTDEMYPHEDHSVSQIILHPEYKSHNLHNDIAILKLADVVEFKPHIDTACLPHDDDDFTGHDCVVTGWGSTAYDDGMYSNIMKEVTVPIVGHDECQKKLRKTRLGRFYKLHSGFLCAGGEEGKDSCKGDGGGPLVCYKDDNSYTVVGLVAWGIDCGTKDNPGVYVNVQKYIDWIAMNTEKPITEYWRPT